MQLHGPNELVSGIQVSYYGPGRIALTFFATGIRLVLEDAADDMTVINAMAEVRRLRRMDEQLQPPAPYRMPLDVVGSEG